jgi:hypothetical protein
MQRTWLYLHIAVCQSFTEPSFHFKAMWLQEDKCMLGYFLKPGTTPFFTRVTTAADGCFCELLNYFAPIE